MPITVTCPTCSAKIKAPDAAAGKRVKCPKCSEPLLVPSAAGPTPDWVQNSPPAPSPRRPRPPVQDEEHGDQDDGPRSRRIIPDVAATPSKVGLGLGVASLVIGIIALLLSCMPCVGVIRLPLSGLGLLLGVGGAVFCMMKKGSGFGMTIAGSSVSAVALVFGIVWLTLIAAAPSHTDTSSQPTVTQIGTPAATPTTSPTATPATPANPPPSANPPTPAGVVWADASREATQLGEIRVRVTAAQISTVALHGPTGDGTSKEPLLQIAVSAENLSANKLIHLRGWGDADFTGVPGLTDNFNNSYRASSFGIFDHPVGQIVGEADIRPGQAVGDVLIFDTPLNGVQYLRLSLPAGNFGGEGELRLQIPVSMIRR